MTFYFWSSTYTARLKLQFQSGTPFLKVWIRPCIMLRCRLCSTRYTAVRIKNCLKSTSAIKIATMRATMKIRTISVSKGSHQHCACDTKFSVEHSFTCPKGGFPSIRHNELEIRDLTQLVYLQRSVRWGLFYGTERNGTE